MTDKQYEKRDAAFKAYLEANTAAVYNGRWKDSIANAAFNAGWEARKRAEYETMIERTPYIPTRHLLRLTDLAIEALKR